MPDDSVFAEDSKNIPSFSGVADVHRRVSLSNLVWAFVLAGDSPAFLDAVYARHFPGS